MFHQTLTMLVVQAVERNKDGIQPAQYLICTYKDIDNLGEKMQQNALNAGFSLKDIEILTKSEFDARIAVNPIPEQVSADAILNAKIEIKTIETLLDLGVI